MGFRNGDEIRWWKQVYLAAIGHSTNPGGVADLAVHDLQARPIEPPAQPEPRTSRPFHTLPQGECLIISRARANSGYEVMKVDIRNLPGHRILLSSGNATSEKVMDLALRLRPLEE